MTDLAKAFAQAERDFRAGLPSGWDAPLVTAGASSDGRLAAATDATSTGSLAACLLALRSGAGDCRPGDVVITNDVYHGSTHPTEFTAATPLTRDGRVDAWVLVRTSLPDIGGWDIGGYSSRALDVWSEGARFVPAKVFREGKPRREVLDMLALNSRTPGLNIASATALGKTALSLAHALAPIASTFHALADEADLRAVESLGRVEGGEGTATLRAPSVTPLPIRVRITPGKTRLLVSFPDLPGASDHPLNATASITMDAIVAALSAALRIDPQATIALHRHIDLDLPVDGILSATRRRPAGWARAFTARAVFDAVCNALGASSDSRWPAKDPHLDAASGQLLEPRRRIIESIERGI